MIKRHPVVAYFVLTFLISWAGAFAVAAPHLLRHEALSGTTGILMFPVMLLGPSLAGMLLTRIVDGNSGLQVLFSQMLQLRVRPAWYLTLLIPPALVLAVLLLQQRFVSPAYAPNRFFLGILFGVPAGLLEEIGWTGYAFRKMRLSRDGLVASIQLGLVWSLWHLPVIDHLGTVTPHRAYWLSFFLAFSVAMVAMRVLVGWIYANTQSVLLTQLMHMSSTGSLVVFSATRVTGRQEAIWYALYGLVLWVAVGIVVNIFGRNLGPTVPSVTWRKP
jgi:membrane protease YdiL (CAAX protease family)